MTNNDISVQVTFDADNKRVKVTDLADYTALNVVTNAIKGTGQLNDPLGDIVFQKLLSGSPLIDLAAGDTVSAWYNLPQTNSGAILNGTYPLTYNVIAPYNLTGIIIVSLVASTKTIVVDFDRSYLQAGDTLTISGSSNGNDGAKVVATAVYDSGLDRTTIVCASGTFGTDEPDPTSAVIAYNVTRTYTKDFTYTYSGCTAVTPIVTIESSCTDENITIYDNTVTSGQTVVSRVLTLIYPDGLVDPTPISPVTTANSSYTVGELANGTYTGTLTLNMSYTQTTDDLVVTYSVYKAVEHAVSCSLNLCCLTDCLDKLYAAYSPDATCPVDTAYQTMIIRASFLMNQYNILKGCGDLDGASAVAAELKTLLGETCTCCDDNADSPSWVNSSISNLTSAAGSMDVLYFNDTRLITSATFLDGNDYVTIPLSSFDVGDCIEVDIRANYVNTGANIRVQNLTTLEDWTGSATDLAANEYGRLMLRAVRTSVEKLTVIKEVEILSATPTIAINQYIGTFAYDINTPMVIQWVPSDPDAISYYWVKVMLVKKPA